jgi:hypothetical protein
MGIRADSTSKFSELRKNDTCGSRRRPLWDPVRLIKGFNRGWAGDGVVLVIPHEIKIIAKRLPQTDT